MSWLEITQTGNGEAAGYWTQISDKVEPGDSQPHSATMNEQESKLG